MTNPSPDTSLKNEPTTRGKVTADKLNVRSGAGVKYKKVHSLSRNAVVDIVGRIGSWCGIRFKNGLAFVHSDYVETAGDLKSIRGKVTASALDVRDEPGASGNRIGSLKQGAVVDILAQHPNWLEISFNDSNAFIHSDYVELLAADRGARGKVTADVLNVRRQPGLQGDVAGQLSKDAVIDIRSVLGQWYELSFNGAPAYVHRKYVETLSDEAAAAGDVQPTRPALNLQDDTMLDLTPMEPEHKLDIDGTSIMKEVIRTWNAFGGLVEAQSRVYQIDTGCALAVLCVESAGKGFEHNNDNRMVIRFENHKFWAYWGKNNPDEFNKYFKYGVREGGKSLTWKGHLWRPDEAEDWQQFHGSQVREWQVFECARALDDTGALNSISMGAPQIMGFNYERLGYETVQDMFQEFSRDIRYHIVGMFRFLDDAMLEALRSLNFEKFAASYNGPGQKEVYGARIKSRYEEFEKLGI